MILFPRRLRWSRPRGRRGLRRERCRNLSGQLLIVIQKALRAPPRTARERTPKDSDAGPAATWWALSPWLAACEANRSDFRDRNCLEDRAAVLLPLDSIIIAIRWEAVWSLSSGIRSLTSNISCLYSRLTLFGLEPLNHRADVFPPFARANTESCHKNALESANDIG